MTKSSKPTAYGYVRVSADIQAKSGLGLAAQKKTIEDYCRVHNLALAEIFRDAAVSASRHKLPDRPAGRKLLATAQRGDHIVIAKLDRAFRSLRDFAVELDRWQKRGVIIHLLDLHVDTATPVGKLIASVMAAVAEWEAKRIGERISAASQAAKAAGFSPVNRPRLGAKLDRRKRRGKMCKVVCDPTERKVMSRIVKLRRTGQYLWREIAALLGKEGIKTRDGRGWSKQRCWRAYHAELELRGQNINLAGRRK